MSTIGEGVKTEVVAIDPAGAEELLGHNINNRGVKRRVVMTYADDMSKGRWQLAGAPIVLAEDGTLLDGQHRLLAVIESGRTIEFLLVHGVKRDVQPVIDTGAKRTFGDVLTMRGETHAMSLAAITKIVAMWDPDEGLPSSNATPSNTALIEFLAAHPELRDIARRMASLKEQIRGIRPAAFGAFLWLIDQIDSEDAEAFVGSYVTGIDLAEGSPILALRNYADNLMFNESRQRGSSLNSRLWIALMIKAWNAWREGREVKILAWKRGGANPERFPIPV